MIRYPHNRIDARASYPAIFIIMLRFFIFCLMISVFFLSCSRRDSIAHNSSRVETRPLLALSILPQTWFAQRLAGDRVRTLVLAGPGQNPHNYEPTPVQMKELAQAGAWVLSGVEFEISLAQKIRSIFSNLVIIDGTEGVRFRMMEPDDDDSHSEGIDRHTWLGFEPAKILSAHILEALILIDPAGEDAYNANFEALINDINNVRTSLRSELAPLKGSSVYVYHPSFGYFLDEFGIRQEAVETGGKEPGPRELARLISEMKQKKVAAIFVQAQFPVNAAETVAHATGAQLISLDPLSAEWLDNILVMGNALKAAAQTSGSVSAGGFRPASAPASVRTE